ncbi:MAG: flagellar hook associated protein [Sulfobacillus thermosulfidooxidans]|uniref:flagellar hook associated protein n=1 Tax=Sulfobacillus TaxID=28033 RepID=UPI000CD2B8A1|nr:flagellar hook associated protein [Sulfobacillus sp. hq2]POB10419.1 flagellar hook associated protein [Sulfobacillus sp. hq2]PSR34768.1 MAG: flagellar hook associated protein [Sulfobacillus thermosulfidooxidans]
MGIHHPSAILGPSATAVPQEGGPGRASATGVNFQALVQERVTLSQHAMSRMQARHMTLSEADTKRLGEAMTAVDSKGSKQAAIILGNDIYIVSPPARTVITSIHPPTDGMKVITQVDAVVYISRTSHQEIEEASGSRTTDGTAAAPHWSLITNPET